MRHRHNCEDRKAIRRRYLEVRERKLNPPHDPEPETRISLLDELMRFRTEMLTPPPRWMPRFSHSWADEDDFPYIVGLRRSRVQYDPWGPRHGKLQDDEPDPGWDDHVKLLEEDSWQLAYEATQPQSQGGTDGEVPRE